MLNNSSSSTVRLQSPVISKSQNGSMKNIAIRDTLKKTRERRTRQICKQYELKIDRSHLNEESEQHLNRLFLEAKWFYNDILASQRIFDLPKDHYKIEQVQVKVRDRYETRKLENLSSQMKQEILDMTKDSIRGLSVLRRNGRKVGKLKFKSAINSIPLKQYGNTWKIIGNSHIHIQGIKKPLRVRGIFQISKYAEIASALLIRKHEDWYVHVTTFQTKVVSVNAEQQTQEQLGTSSIGIDIGIKNQLTLSDGIRINYEVPVTEEMMRLCRRLSKKRYRSRNWWKTRTRLEKAYDRTTSIKKDIRNKLVQKLTGQFNTICFQDDSIKAWQRIWGRRILNTSLGGITSALVRKARTPRKITRFVPTTLKCSRCNNRNETNLGDRTYQCVHCGLSIDRDLNAAINIQKEGTPTVRREFTPADTLAATLVEYFNSIPHVRASMVVETGSPAVVVERSTIFSRV
jgi:putative transposase